MLTKYLSAIGDALDAWELAEEITDEHSQGGKLVTPGEAHVFMREVYSIAQRRFGWTQIAFVKDRPTQPGLYFLNLPTELTSGRLEGMLPGVNPVVVNLKGEGALSQVGRSNAIPLPLVQDAIDSYTGTEDIGWQGPISPVMPISPILPEHRKPAPNDGDDE